MTFPGKRDKYVQGGIHMTNPAFLPTAILKELSATEDNFYTGFLNTAYLLSMSKEDLDSEQENLYNMVDKQCWLAQCDDMKEVLDVEKFVPWFLSCNPNRYPYWFGHPDPRNEDLHRSMQDVNHSLQHVAQSYWTRSDVQKLFKKSIFAISGSKKVGKNFNAALDCIVYINFE